MTREGPIFENDSQPPDVKEHRAISQSQGITPQEHAPGIVREDSGALQAEDIKSIEEVVSNQGLAPSVFEHKFLTIFGRGTGETTGEVYKNYIESLSTKSAKEVLAKILAYSELHPELLRKLGPEKAKEYLPKIANMIASSQGAEPFIIDTSSAIEMFVQEVEKLQKDLEKKGTHQEAKSGALDHGKFPQKFIENEEEGEGEHENLDRKIILEGLDYFPGLPEFTEFVKRFEGHRSLRLIKETSRSRDRMTVEEDAYDIYFDNKEMGRYTIRRNGGMIERSVLFTFPQTGDVQTFGISGSALEDVLRRTKEWTKVKWERVKSRF